MGEVDWEELDTDEDGHYLCPNCNNVVCDECHACHECSWNEHSGKSPTPKVPPMSVNIRTQKARGYATLARYGYTVPEWHIAQTEDEAFKAAAAIIGWYGKAIARPCPEHARHGFVDSVFITKPEDAVEVFRKAQAVDPNAELLICQAISADANVIWTPGLMAIGPGHDGATGGKDCVEIPLAGGMSKNVREILPIAGIDASKDDPYIEAVLYKNILYYTQLREGVKVNGGGNFVPRTFTVEKVVVAEGDLLEWEAKAKDFGPNTVVYHPGGTQVSHYSVHCRMHNIAIVYDNEPKVGDKLEKCGEKFIPSLMAIRYGIAAATALKLPDMSDDNGQKVNQAGICALLVGMHNASRMGGDSGFFIGAAAALMHRYGTAAALGEARHGNKSTRNVSRTAVYKKAFVAPFMSRRKLRKTCIMFHDHSLWPGGFGGKKWAECTESVIRLDRAIQDVIKKPDQACVVELVDALNQAVNKAHNNGWWLNKFCDTSIFNKAAEGDPTVPLQAAPILWKLAQVQPSALLKCVETWRGTKKIPAEDLGTRLPDSVVAKLGSVIGGFSIIGKLAWKDKNGELGNVANIPTNSVSAASYDTVKEALAKLPPSDVSEYHVGFHKLNMTHNDDGSIDIWFPMGNEKWVVAYHFGKYAKPPVEKKKKAKNG